MTFQLTRDMLGQILGDPEFYRMCPEFADLRKAGVNSYNAYMSDLLGNCKGCHAREILQPAITEMLRRIRELSTTNPAELENLKDYLGVRRKHRPDQVSVRHKLDGRLAQITF
jgi:hypothetical protein